MVTVACCWFTFFYHYSHGLYLFPGVALAFYWMFDYLSPWTLVITLQFSIIAFTLRHQVFFPIEELRREAFIPGERVAQPTVANKNAMILSAVRWFFTAWVLGYLVRWILTLKLSSRLIGLTILAAYLWHVMDANTVLMAGLRLVASALHVSVSTVSNLVHHALFALKVLFLVGVVAGAGYGMLTVLTYFPLMSMLQTTKLVLHQGDVENGMGEADLADILGDPYLAHLKHASSDYLRSTDVRGSQVGAGRNAIDAAESAHVAHPSSIPYTDHLRPLLHPSEPAETLPIPSGSVEGAPIMGDPVLVRGKVKRVGDLYYRRLVVTPGDSLVDVTEQIRLRLGMGDADVIGHIIETPDILIQDDEDVAQLEDGFTLTISASALGKPSETERKQSSEWDEHLSVEL
eukprot:CAMPEP_0119120552 /NCGR_PEP_ID=MMETSP1310-20130426/1540_1 /TAXON_ID=464262 /ORGANISM="Genus nov. species nov., Strain RCC2339" /LENGTH=402 /DNA_ID=CAMNT_0007110033 /DNA_START=447 /DNA_END=1655 /DNA_ORIENTATION=+